MVENMNLDENDESNAIEVDESHIVEQKDHETSYKNASKLFTEMFMDNNFGHVCNVCDRLWFKLDLQLITSQQAIVLHEDFKDGIDLLPLFRLCNTCRQSIDVGKIPFLSRTNGYSYPNHPTHLPPLDPISERLISPRLPFMQIRRL